VCAGILLLSGNPHGGEHLKDLLLGQILWVGTTQNAWLGGITAVLVAAMASGLVTRLGRFGFCATFPIAVTASVQLVLVYFVFTSLIVPARATRATSGMSGMSGRARFIARYSVCAIGYALGLALSALLDLLSDAVSVSVSVSVLAAAAVAFGSLVKARWVTASPGVTRASTRARLTDAPQAQCTSTSERRNL